MKLQITSAGSGFDVRGQLLRGPGLKSANLGQQQVVKN